MPLGSHLSMEDTPTLLPVSPKKKTKIESYLDKAKAAGLNAVFIHVRPYADRLYEKNSYSFEGTTYRVAEPISRFATGTRGSSTNFFDMLEYWVQEGHKRGIEVHAWVNPYRWADISGEHYKGEVPNQRLTTTLIAKKMLM